MEKVSIFTNASNIHQQQQSRLLKIFSTDTFRAKSSRQRLSPPLSFRKLDDLKGILMLRYRLQSQPYAVSLWARVQKQKHTPPLLLAIIAAFLSFLQHLRFTLPNPILLASLFTHSLSSVGNMTRKEKGEWVGETEHTEIYTCDSVLEESCLKALFIYLFIFLTVAYALHFTKTCQ